MLDHPFLGHRLVQALLLAVLLVFSNSSTADMQPIQICLK